MKLRSEIFLRGREAGLGRVLLLSASGLVLAVSGTNAFAQGATTESVSDGSGAAEIGIEEIVVTANRREQKLQDVPIAISAVTAQMAERQGVTGTASLQTVVPSLVITRSANQAQPYLRGLGSANGLPNAEPSVAIYIDGVYNPSANANFFEFNNIERIEVLKGPQGTLFGRNATGGVIQIVTKDPGSVPEMDFKVGYANYNTITANAYLAGPISDSLSANVAVLYKNQGEGWGKNIITGRDNRADDNFGVRGKIVWEPGDATAIRLTGDYSHNQNGAINAQVLPGARNAIGQPWPGEYNTTANIVQRSNIETGGVSLKIDHDFEALQVMSLSAYRKTEGFWTYDPDMSIVPALNADPLSQSARMYSQEVHLLSPSSSTLQWLVGAYYFNYRAGYAASEIYGLAFNNPVLMGANPAYPACAATATCGFDRTNGTKSTSFAAFAQASYPILENTNLTLGFRYTWDKVDYFGTLRYHGTSTIVPGIGGPSTGQLKHDKPTFRIAIDHKFTPEIMMYASFNRGVKTGGIETGINNQPQSAQTFFQPEQLNAYELGVKTELFDRKVRFNLGGFYYDFTNMQFQKVILANTLTFNAPNGAEMYGIEAELDARVTSQLTLNGSVGYLHTKIRDFPGAPNTCRSTVTGVNDGGGFFCNGANGLPDPANLIPYNAEGNNTPHSPEWTINGGFVYSIPSSVGEFTLAGNAYHTSKRYFEIDNRLFNRAMWLFNASAKWTDSSGHLSLTAWGRNLGDKYYYAQISGSANGSDIGGPSAPREYGATLGYKF